MSGADLTTAAWRNAVAPFERPSLVRSLWAVGNTLLPFAALWYAMYLSLSVSYWLTLALAVPTAGLYVRLFIIFHDCGHGSFFASRKANDLLGQFLGVLTFSAYFQWRHDHAVHHATSGDLDRRGVGDVTTLTITEYLALPWTKRVGYRIYRHPLVLLLIGPLAKFLVMERFSTGQGGPRERQSVWFTNLGLAAVIGGLSYLIGFKAFLLIHGPVLWLAGLAGVWLFYVQHQFEEMIWERHDNWDYAHQALHGSSFLKLPKVLDWFTGSIGYHHIHHLSPRIPNYRLAECHEQNPLLQVEPISWKACFQALTLTLWDEEQKRLVGFSALKHR